MKLIVSCVWNCFPINWHKKHENILWKPPANNLTKLQQNFNHHKSNSHLQTNCKSHISRQRNTQSIIVIVSSRMDGDDAFIVWFNSGTIIMEGMSGGSPAPVEREENSTQKQNLRSGVKRSFHYCCHFFHF